MYRNLADPPPPPPPPVPDQHDHDDAHAVPEYDPNRDPDSAEAVERLLHAQDVHVARIKNILAERGIHPVLESPDVYIAQTYDEAELLAQLFDHDEFVGLDTKLMPTHYLGVTAPACLGKLVIKYAAAFQRERFPGLVNPPAPVLPVRQLVAILANRYAYWRVVYKESIRRRRLLMAISALAHDGRVLSLVATDHEQAPIVDPKAVEFKSLMGMCVRVNVDADEPAVWEGLAENLARKPRPSKPAAESSAMEPTLALTGDATDASTDAFASAPAPPSTDAPLPPSPVSSVTTAPTSASPMVTLDLADAAMQSPTPSPMDVSGADEDVRLRPIYGPSRRGAASMRGTTR
ncbi:hypothetical protein AMAG_06941 [Allomyces macrogynus ATCC 38327]|uniref:Uncharacterized protein n=1 Tax=Allomyces macrogynus (strain ATCC 38327) TaxID=578462 RepID=A0A0L0SFB3_ALLM3|nr:hypothetical protein AMAG_06941 [Allomyces macrogynus ATCC 38327]|eukprot:KNE61191.1 hypothetical protein AMAG_06941 [Allomyces macrogynus ATCC 38327]